MPKSLPDRMVEIIGPSGSSGFTADEEATKEAIRGAMIRFITTVSLTPLAPIYGTPAQKSEHAEITVDPRAAWHAITSNLPHLAVDKQVTIAHYQSLLSDLQDPGKSTAALLALKDNFEYIPYVNPKDLATVTGPDAQSLRASMVLRTTIRELALANKDHPNPSPALIKACQELIMSDVLNPFLCLHEDLSGIEKQQFSEVMNELSKSDTDNRSKYQALSAINRILKIKQALKDSIKMNLIKGNSAKQFSAIELNIIFLGANIDSDNIPNPTKTTTEGIASTILMDYITTTYSPELWALVLNPDSESKHIPTAAFLPLRKEIEAIIHNRQTASPDEEAGSPSETNPEAPQMISSETVLNSEDRSQPTFPVVEAYLKDLPETTTDDAIQNIAELLINTYQEKLAPHIATQYTTQVLHRSSAYTVNPATWNTAITLLGHLISLPGRNGLSQHEQNELFGEPGRPPPQLPPEFSYLTQNQQDLLKCLEALDEETYTSIIAILRTAGGAAFGPWTSAGRNMLSGTKQFLDWGISPSDPIIGKICAGSAPAHPGLVIAARRSETALFATFHQVVEELSPDILDKRSSPAAKQTVIIDSLKAILETSIQIPDLVHSDITQSLSTVAMTVHIPPDSSGPFYSDLRKTYKEIIQRLLFLPSTGIITSLCLSPKNEYALCVLLSSTPAQAIRHTLRDHPELEGRLYPVIDLLTSVTDLLTPATAEATLLEQGAEIKAPKTVNDVFKEARKRLRNRYSSMRPIDAFSIHRPDLHPWPQTPSGLSYAHLLGKRNKRASSLLISPIVETTLTVLDEWAAAIPKQHPDFLKTQITDNVLHLWQSILSLTTRKVPKVLAFSSHWRERLFSVPRIDPLDDRSMSTQFLHAYGISPGKEPMSKFAREVLSRTNQGSPKETVRYTGTTHPHPKINLPPKTLLILRAGLSEATPKLIADAATPPQKPTPSPAPQPFIPPHSGTSHLKRRCRKSLFPAPGTGHKI